MKKIIVYCAIAVLAVSAIFFGYRLLKSGKGQAPTASSPEKKDLAADQQNDQATNDGTGDASNAADNSFDQALSDQDEADLYSQCEQAQWVEVGQVSGEKKTFTGTLAMDVPFDENGTDTNTENTDLATDQAAYYLDGKDKVAASNEAVLSFFDGRQVAIEGEGGGGQQINAARIKCAGNETDASLTSFRDKVMENLTSNINTLSPQKGQWQVDDFLWPQDGYVYVEYSTDLDSDPEGSDENIYSLLFQVADADGKISTKQIGFMKMGDDDWQVVSGENKFKDTMDDADYYEFQDTLKKWVKVD